MKSSNIQKKVAFVSGASRGIGMGIARSLAKEGYHLILTCQNSGAVLSAFCQELSDTFFIQALPFVGDMADPDFVLSVGNAALDTFGQMDVVVNNAGIAHIGLITDMSVSEWQRLFAVNLSSCFYTTKAFVPQMIHQKSGRIINISSMWGTVGASCEAAYSASKGAINSYTKALAKELAPSGIAVNAIACGVIDTAMNACLSPEELNQLREDIPSGRLGQPEDVGQTVLSLLQAPTYMTGQIIGLDGGFI